VVPRLDASELDHARATTRALVDALGGVEVLVNNAGTGHSTPFLELDLETWQHVLTTDLTGAFVVAQECARSMKDAGNGGRIVNVTSVHEHVPLEARPRTARPNTGSAG
jgi:NAD(P)-dependent dehydrogenase (short-subunit alcohol dehydrogenase family)